MKPFNEAKYKALMDGLECSEVMLSYIEHSSDVFRIDSFFYKKEFLRDEYLLSSVSHTFLRDLSSPLRSFGAYSLNNEVVYQKSGIPFIRGVNMKNGIINFENTLFINKYAHHLLWKSEVFPENILLSMSGSIGEVGIALPTWEYPINSNQDIAKIAVDSKLISPYFVYTFMRSKFGQNFLIREARGSVQQHVFLSQIELMLIPRVSRDLESKIADIAMSGLNLFEAASSTYKEAQALLLSALNYHPIAQKDTYTTKSFSESFSKSGRLDAEYYQPKYDEVCASLHTSNTVRSLCVLHDCNFIPNGKQKYTYIELADVGQMGEISGADPVYGAELPTRARRRVEAGQVIISSIEGSLQSCAVITDEFNGALCSTGFYVLTSESLNPETLLVLFKSEPIQTLMKQRCSGTILTAISKDELLSMPLPRIDNKTQEVIAEKVQESFSLRRQSKQLLENAKCAVELAIEQGEDQAMRWLQEQGKI